MKKRIMSILLAAVMLFTVLAGCGSLTNPNDKDGEAKTSLRIAKATDIRTLVPLTTASTAANDGTFTFALYDAIMWRNDDGTYSPGLATEWDVTPDGLVYTLKIREGVKFHNGTDLTPKDVAWTFNMINENPAYKSSVFPTFDHAEVADDNTVKIYLSEAFAPFFNVFSSYLICVLSEDYYNQVGGWEGYLAHPIGCGPYEFVSYETGGTLSLKANENYWNGEVPFDTIDVTIIADTNSRMMALESGQVDVVMDADVETLSRFDGNKKIAYQATNGNTTTCLFFSARHEVTADDINFRKAVLSAIDYEGINQAINLGHSEVAIIPGAPGLTARPDEEDCVKPLTYDVEKAKEFLAASNYHGQKIDYKVQSGSVDETVGKMVQSNLQAIGIDVSLSVLDNATFMSEYIAGNYDLAGLTIFPSRTDMNNIYQFFDTTTASDPENLWEYADEINELGQRGVRLTDNEERKKVYAELTNLLNEEALVGCLFHQTVTLAWNPDLQGISVQAFPKYDITKWHWK